MGESKKYVRHITICVCVPANAFIYIQHSNSGIKLLVLAFMTHPSVLLNNKKPLINFLVRYVYHGPLFLAVSFCYKAPINICLPLLKHLIT